MSNENDFLFVVFEGPDGSGKTTIIENVHQKALAGDLGDRNWCRLRQPHALRDEISKTDPDNYLRMMYLFMKDREIQLPTLHTTLAGMSILMDRYYYSTLVYQGLLGNIPYTDIVRGHEGIIRQPDLVIFVDATDEIIQQRLKISRGGDALANFDEKGRYQQQIREAYRKLHHDEQVFSPGQCTVVLNNGSIHDVIDSCVQEIQQALVRKQYQRLHGGSNA